MEFNNTNTLQMLYKQELIEPHNPHGTAVNSFLLYTFYKW